jgi:hypothetical protein
LLERLCLLRRGRGDVDGLTTLSRHGDYAAITAYVAAHDISRCSTFAVTGLLSDERIVYFLLTRQVNRGAGDACTIALTPQVQPDQPARL